MKEEKHEHYLSPTIIEAVVELFFNEHLTSADNEKIEKKFGKKYSLKKDKLTVYTAEFNPTGMSLKHDDPGHMRLMLTLEDQAFAQIFPDKFSFHWVGKYPGGKVFHTKFQEFMTEFCKVLPRIMGQRIGIRYINKLDQKNAKQTVGYWIKSSANFPENLRTARSDYFFKGKWPLKKNRYTQLYIAESHLENEHFKPLILDIDVIQNLDSFLKPGTPLFKIVLELHNEVYNVFASSISLNYKKILKNRN